MKKLITPLLLSMTLTAPGLASSIEPINSKEVSLTVSKSLISWEQFEDHCAKLTGEEVPPKGLLKVIYRVFGSDPASKQELDQGHLDQVEIYLRRIPLSSSIRKKYSLRQIVEGLHMLSAKYNIDEYDLPNSEYSNCFRNSDAVLKYINKLELRLLSALDFNLHLTIEDVRNLNIQKQGLNSKATSFEPRSL